MQEVENDIGSSNREKHIETNSYPIAITDEIATTAQGSLPSHPQTAIPLLNSYFVAEYVGIEDALPLNQ